MRLINLTGKVFGYLRVICRRTCGGRRVRWLCVCRCGKLVDVAGDSLHVGDTRSCGCYHRRRASESNITHGHSTRSVMYSTWCNMKTRCTNINSEDYPNYGGRGIMVCDRWSAFENFLEDMGERPPGRSIDRIDNDGNYEPTNCRWATPTQQRHNRRDSVPC